MPNPHRIRPQPHSTATDEQTAKHAPEPTAEPTSTGAPTAQDASGDTGADRADELVASPPNPDPAVPARPASKTRTSAMWTGMWAAAAVLILFIVFLLSNTAAVRITFLGWHGNLPLAAALLIAMVTGLVITLVIGTARITQLRRVARRRQQRPPAAIDKHR